MEADVKNIRDGADGFFLQRGDLGPCHSSDEQPSTLSLLSPKLATQSFFNSVTDNQVVNLHSHTHLHAVEYFIHDFQPLVFVLHVLNLKGGKLKS